MTTIAIQKHLEEARDLPIFQDLAARLDDVRKRAFDLFERRGFELGHDMEDWLAAERDVLGWPAAELKDHGKDFEVDVTLPGFAAKEIELTATPSELILHAATEKRESGGDGHVLWSEFGSNDVYRHFEFPVSIDAGKVSADLENGLLRIRVPKANTAAPEPIKVPVK
ncbi:MAG: Hsp20/alpha crystallin family protein [Gemmatimonadaceae bacterium]